MKFRILATLCTMLPCGCRSPGRPVQQDRSRLSSIQAAAITGHLADLLAQQADTWNRGDLEGFMSFYWQSDELTFVSGERVIRGWQATLDRYKKRYPTRADMGLLDFEDLRIDAHSGEQAQVAGKWRVRAKGKELGGGFLLTFRKFDGRWLIVRDHTTSNESDNNGGHQP